MRTSVSARLTDHIKRSLATLSSVAVDRLAALVRNRLERLQYRPDMLDGFLTGTGDCAVGDRPWPVAAGEVGPPRDS
ncbi:hypothetical protein ACFW1A_18630 [Kitasatospora sp. NPDC058965]|uniref:hypothetical protein n=1 Tax=Kitasatospora sp. NPDC058965 TaxID=3346682 RepID=UPI00369BBAF0